MTALPDELKNDVEDIAGLQIVPTMLNVLCQTTGMGFAAVARVTDEHWVVCSVIDTINMGLKPGDQLDVNTTLCNELKVTAQPLVIENIDDDAQYSNHITPATYGFKSYVSVPVFRKDGRYFGSLFSIDPKPRQLNKEAVAGMLGLFSQLIALHLSANEQIKLSEIQYHKDRAFINALEVKVEEHTRELKESNEVLARANKELEAFAYISSHDLQEPLRKIQTLSSMITEKESAGLSERALDYFTRIKSAAGRMQALINDLLTYSRADMAEKSLKETNLEDLIQQVKEDLGEELRRHEAIIEAGPMCTLKIIPFQFRQLLQNLFTNSIKFAKPGVPPHITVRCNVVTDAEIENLQLKSKGKHYKISVADNGIGFEQQYAEKIFMLFQRLNDKNHFSGTGIGLAIVKKIIDNHNGCITASGRPGQGATFNIYIPASL
jgi:signal transduction histidine kinase